MIKKQIYLFLTLTMAFTACVKETYNMNKLSNDIHYSPTFGMSVANGDISLSDIMKPNDTIIYDSDKFVRIIFSEDSVINLKLKDFYNLTDMVNYTSGYTIGEMHIADFQSNYSLTLNQMTNTFSAPLRTQIQGLDDGSTHIFPPFPQTDMGDLTFPAFGDFTYAVFATGTIQLSVKNNLPVSLNGIKIKLLNSSDRSPIGNEVDMASIAPGATSTASIDLAGKRVTNSVIAVVTQKGSPGSSPASVIVDLDNSIDIGIIGSLLKIQSGRVKLPSQLVISMNDKDTISFDPGSNVEIEKFKIATGNLSYTLTSRSQIRASFVMTLPSTDRSGIPVAETIPISTPNTVKSGTISLNNTLIDLSRDPKQIFNRLPVAYAVTVSSNGNMIDFNRDDSINIDFRLQDPNFDYVKGYFGKLTETIDPESVDLKLDDILKKISGDFHISNPSITLNYFNSFGIPIKVFIDAKGRNYKDSVDLDLDSLTIAYPTDLITRDVSSSFPINKSNSALPDLISLPPSVIRFSGSASMNPGGMAAVGGRNNYVFGNSRFRGDLEVEVPMEFWINNLQFADTVDNFLSNEDSQNNDFSPSDMDYTRLDIAVNNEFPLGLSLKMALYDSVSKDTLKTINASQFLTPAPVDAYGRSSGTSESVTSIVLNQNFFNSVNDADKIIFIFKLNTTGNGANDIKIYSDYMISFRASIVAKPEINLK
jgi:hypothetical protein